MNRSADSVLPLPPGAWDLAVSERLAAAAAQRSFLGEIILFESDLTMRGWAFNFVLQLRGRGYEHWLLLSDGAASCDTVHADWTGMIAAHGVRPLSCVYSSQPAAHPGWDRWLGQGWSSRSGEPNVYPMWATRWWVSLQLLRLGHSVLSLDADAVLLSDVYALLHALPLSLQDVIISDNAEEDDETAAGLNCGFVYLNTKAAANRKALAQPARLGGDRKGALQAGGLRAGGRAGRRAAAAALRADGGGWGEGQRGYCRETVEGIKGNCANGEMGQFPWPPLASLPRANASAWCKRQCEGCARCGYISFSHAQRDCSWYRRCGSVCGSASNPTGRIRRSSLIS